jgi:hypothetical protein
MMKTIFASLLCFVFCSFRVPYSPGANNASRAYIELRVYHCNTPAQLSTLDSFFKSALVPALHQAGQKQIGVFFLSANDTASDKKAYVLIPYKSLKDFEETASKLQKNPLYSSGGAGSYLNADYTQPPFSRYETILLHAFEDAPDVKSPQLTGKKGDRVYELRSYEGSTEKYYRNKVEMFNKGGEVKLFERLGFNAVFYGEVLAGSRMPNLMYMTSFDNKAARDEHWKSFGSDPVWKTLSAKPEYQHNVSKIDIQFLTPAEYSEL